MSRIGDFIIEQENERMWEEMEENNYYENDDCEDRYNNDFGDHYPEQDSSDCCGECWDCSNECNCSNSIFDRD